MSSHATHPASTDGNDEIEVHTAHPTSTDDHGEIKVPQVNIFPCLQVSSGHVLPSASMVAIPIAAADDDTTVDIDESSHCEDSLPTAMATVVPPSNNSRMRAQCPSSTSSTRNDWKDTGAKGLIKILFPMLAFCVIVLAPQIVKGRDGDKKSDAATSMAAQWDDGPTKRRPATAPTLPPLFDYTASMDGYPNVAFLVVGPIQTGYIGCQEVCRHAEACVFYPSMDTEQQNPSATTNNCLCLEKPTCIWHGENNNTIGGRLYSKVPLSCSE